MLSPSYHGLIIITPYVHCNSHVSQDRICELENNYRSSQSWRTCGLQVDAFSFAVVSTLLNEKCLSPVHTYSWLNPEVFHKKIFHLMQDVVQTPRGKMLAIALGQIQCLLFNFPNALERGATAFFKEVYISVLTLALLYDTVLVKMNISLFRSEKVQSKV